MKRLLLCFNILLLSGILSAQAPYASYPLDENANDISGHNLHGNIVGSPTSASNRYNQSGKALNLNGSSDYIILPNDFDFPTRSVILWFNTNYIGSGNNLNDLYDSDHPNIQNGATGIAISSGAENFLNIGSDQYIYKSSLNLNTWYQTALVRTPSAVKFYLNGVLVYTGLNPNGAHSNNTTSYTAVVGADRGYSAKYYGKLDDLKIYDVALTDSAIFSDFNAGSYRFNINDTTHVSIAVTDTLLIDAQLTGISSPNNINRLKVFPNPAKDHITIDAGNYIAMNGYILKISNSLGQDVFTSPVNQQIFNIDLNTWTGKGTYVMYIFDPQLSVIATKKIIIQ